jgi:hypothetical protein
MKRKVLTIEEIHQELERRKTIKRERLQKKIMKLTDSCDKEDVLYVFSSLISKIVK